MKKNIFMCFMVILTISMLTSCKIDNEKAKLDNEKVQKSESSITSEVKKESTPTLGKDEKKEISSNNQKTINEGIKMFALVSPEGSYEYDNFGRKVNIPAKFQSLVAIPEGKGPFPVVFILHGNSPDCVWGKHSERVNSKDAALGKWNAVCPTAEKQWKILPEGIKNPYSYSGPDYLESYLGFSYLAKHFAKNGILAVSLDVNANANTNLADGTDPMQTKVAETSFKKYYDFYTQLNEGKNLGFSLPTELKGKFDFSKVSIVGHSVGATMSVFLGTNDKVPNIKSIVALQAGGGDVNQIKYPVNTMILRGSCDEQLGAEAGKEFGEKVATLKPKYVLDVFVEGIGHGQINTSWSGSECKGKTTRQQAEQAVAATSLDFVKASFDDSKMKIGVMKDMNIVVTDMLTNQKFDNTYIVVQEKLSERVIPKKINKIKSKKAFLNPMTDTKKIGEFMDF